MGYTIDYSFLRCLIFLLPALPFYRHPSRYDDPVFKVNHRCFCRGTHPIYVYGDNAYGTDSGVIIRRCLRIRESSLPLASYADTSSTYLLHSLRASSGRWSVEPSICHTIESHLLYCIRDTTDDSYHSVTSVSIPPFLLAPE